MATPLANTALVVIDVQDLYARQNPGTVQRIFEATSAQRGQMPILWVYWDPFPRSFRHLNASYADRLPQVFGAGDAQTFTNALAYDQKYPERPALLPQHGDWMTAKSGLSLMSNPFAQRFLQRQGIGHLVLAGFAASQCVHRSAKAALQAGLQVSLDPTLTADTADQIHAQKDPLRLPGVRVLEPYWWQPRATAPAP